MHCVNLVVFSLASISIASGLIDGQGIRYMVFTRAKEYELEDHNLNALNRSKMTKFILHGWTQDITVQNYIDMKDEYLKYFDYNIVLVDWSKYAKRRYLPACKTLSKVGCRIASVVTALNLPLENIHVIGHSLGGQLAGVVGRKARRLLGKKLKRITGLDPARPLFEGVTAIYRCVSRTDAEVVDIIHTNSLILGIAKPVGTMDFYPNGGMSPQPGCDPSTNEDRGGGLAPSAVRCSHHKSNQYFTQSIGAERYVGHICRYWREFIGGKCNQNARVIMGEHYVYQLGVVGTVFLSTTDFSKLILYGSYVDMDDAYSNTIGSVNGYSNQSCSEVYDGNVHDIVGVQMTITKSV